MEVMAATWDEAAESPGHLLSFFLFRRRRETICGDGRATGSKQLRTLRHAEEAAALDCCPGRKDIV